MASDHQLAYASFSIYQDAEPPEFWTNYFGIAPDVSTAKGQHRITPSGQLSKFPSRIGVWGISSKAAVQNDLLEPHLRYLVERLALPRTDIRELVERTGARMRFFCYWANYTGHRVPDVPGDLRAMMEAMGGTVEIDEYR